MKVRRPSVKTRSGSHLGVAPLDDADVVAKVEMVELHASADRVLLRPLALGQRPALPDEVVLRVAP